MDVWIDLVVGSLDILPEVKALISLIGVCYMLEIITSVVAFIGGVKR